MSHCNVNRLLSALRARVVTTVSALAMKLGRVPDNAVLPCPRTDDDQPTGLTLCAVAAPQDAEIEVPDQPTSST